MRNIFPSSVIYQIAVQIPNYTVLSLWLWNFIYWSRLIMWSKYTSDSIIISLYYHFLSSSHTDQSFQIEEYFSLRKTFWSCSDRWMWIRLLFNKCLQFKISTSDGCSVLWCEIPNRKPHFSSRRTFWSCSDRHMWTRWLLNKCLQFKVSISGFYSVLCCETPK
jgi:hypothetical protein